MLEKLRMLWPGADLNVGQQGRCCACDEMETQHSQYGKRLNANRPHPRDYPQMPPDYRDTDKDEGCRSSGSTGRVVMDRQTLPSTVEQQIFACMKFPRNS